MRESFLILTSESFSIGMPWLPLKKKLALLYASMASSQAPKANDLFPLLMVV